MLGLGLAVLGSIVSSSGAAAVSTATAISSAAAAGAAGMATAAGGAMAQATAVALSTAAEMATVAAAESSVMVGQIPVVGETVSGAVNATGGLVGQISTQAASSMGLSNSTANAIGTIAGGTTTNEINKQILKPYNEIKDELTGLAELKENVRVMNDLLQGRLELEDLQDLAARYKDELLQEVVDEETKEQLEALLSGEMVKEDMEEVLAEVLGVDEETTELAYRLAYQSLAGTHSLPLSAAEVKQFMEQKDCFLASWLTLPQGGEFYDIYLPKQALKASNFGSVAKFFPSGLLIKEATKSGEEYFLQTLDIQHIGAPVVYAVLNYLAEAGLQFELKEAHRKITLTALGEHQLEVLEAYCHFTGVDYETGFKALEQLPCELPLTLTVEAAVPVVQCLKYWGCEFLVEKCGETPEFKWDLHLTEAGTKEFGVVKQLVALDYRLEDAIKLIRASYKESQRIVGELTYEAVLEIGNKLRTEGASVLLTPAGAATEGFAVLNKDLAQVNNLLKILPTLEEGATIRLGNYWQSNAENKEPIEWILLKHLVDKDGKEGLDGYYFISKYGLENQPFDVHNTSDWNTCSVRDYLEYFFVPEAFNSAEAMVINDQIPEGAIQSKLFLMHVGEAERYFKSNEERRCQPTAYAKQKGAWSNDAEGDVNFGNGWWWLRSRDGNSVRSVANNGGINPGNTHYTNAPEGIIRPCFIIELPHFEA